MGGGGLPGKGYIHHYLLNPKRTFIVFHDVNVISEGIVVFWYHVLFVLLVGIETYIEVAYGRWWVFLNWKLNITVLVFFIRYIGYPLRLIAGWLVIPSILYHIPSMH